MPIMNGIRVVAFSSADPDSAAELDYFMTRKPLGNNLRLYFDGRLLIDITDQGHPDYDDIVFS